MRRGGLDERRVAARVEAARARQVDVHHPLDAARARAHDHYAVGEQHGLVDAVGDEHDGLLRGHPQSLEVDAHLLAREGVERAERLVHQQQRRIVDQRAHDSRALAHAAGELARVAVREVREAHLREEPHRALAVGLRVHAAQLDLHQHVVEHVAPVQQHRALEHDAEVGLRAGHAPAAHDHLARARRMQPRDDPQQRALAAARGADDREELAFADREVDGLQRVRLARSGAVALAIGLGHAAQVDVDRAVARSRDGAAASRLCTTFSAMRWLPVSSLAFQRGNRCRRRSRRGSASPRPPASRASGQELVGVERRPRLVRLQVAVVLEDRQRLVPVGLRAEADAALLFLQSISSKSTSIWSSVDCG